MYRLTILLGAQVLVNIVDAQNLVANGSFEEYSYCPEHWSQFAENVADWSVCANSPDYLNACRDMPDFGVPLNLFGNQLPSAGEAYVGLCTYKVNAPNFREIICAPLSTPLTVGVPVNLSMKVACGGFGTSSSMSAKWTCRGIGMRFSTHPVDWPQATYPNAAALYLDEVLMDTVNWIHLSGEILPDSAYAYLSIGNFFEDSQSTPVVLDPMSTAEVAYAFVDEVCVTLQTAQCETGNSIRPYETLPEWSVVTPFTDRLNVTFNKPVHQTLHLALYDLNGRMITTLVVSKGSERVQWETGSIAEGTYLLSILDRSGSNRPKRVLHISP